MRFILDCVLFLLSMVVYAVLGAAILMLLPKQVRRQVMYLGVRVLRWIAPAYERASAWVAAQAEETLAEARAAARKQRTENKLTMKKVS